MDKKLFNRKKVKKETIFGSKLTQDAEVGQKRKWDDGEENQVEICSKKSGEK